MLVKKRRGHRVGHIAWGWYLADDGCTLERDADGAATLQLLRELRAPGYTLRALARELNTRHPDAAAASLVAQVRISAARAAQVGDDDDED